MQNRYRILLAVGTVAAIGIVSAIATAQTTDAVYYGCLSDNGNLSNVSVDVEPTCKSKDTLIQWNETGPQGPPGSSGGLFTPVSETVFGVTSDGCPAGEWKLEIVSQSGEIVPWDTFECGGIRVQGPGYVSWVEMNAYGSIDGVPALDGTSYDEGVVGKVTYLDDGPWRLNCYMTVGAYPGDNDDWGRRPGNIWANCAAHAANGNEARLAEVLDSGELESQSFMFFR